MTHSDLSPFTTGDMYPTPDTLHVPEHLLGPVRHSDAPTPMPVQEIKDALDAHVIDGVSADKMIRQIFAPLCDLGYISLNPGQGVKRPSYEFTIPELSMYFARCSTKAMAEKLHALSKNITMFDLTGGEIELLVFSYAQTPQTKIVRAPNLATARAAYSYIDTRRTKGMCYSLPHTARDLIPHVAIARTLLGERALKSTTKAQRQGVAFIDLMEDLRVVASVTFRRIETLRSWNRLYVDFVCENGDIKVSIQETDDVVRSGHDHIQRAAKFLDLELQLAKMATERGLYDILPEACRVSLNGDCTYLGVSITDQRKNPNNPKHYFSCSNLEYSNLKDLVEYLEMINDTPKTKKEHEWHLTLHERNRSKTFWCLTGETLAEAFANNVQDEGRASMLLNDLIIDLAATEEGKDPEIELKLVV